MNDTKKQEKINFIKKKAGELFDEIEDLIEAIGPDETSELLCNEMGASLKKSDGFEELRFAHVLAQTKSEQAIYCLEEASRCMDDETLYDLYQLATRAEELSNEFNKGKPNTDRIRWRINELGNLAPGIREELITEWWARAQSYRGELEEIKKAG